MRWSAWSLLACGEIWPQAPPGVVAPLAEEGQEDAQVETQEAALHDLRLGPDAELVQRALLAEDAVDPAKAAAREQVDVRMRAVHAAMAAMQKQIAHTRHRTEKALRSTESMHNSMRHQEKEAAKQMKMYSAGALNENKLHAFDESLMQNLDHARLIEAELGKETAAEKARVRNETQTQLMTMGMIVDWMQEKNGTSEGDYMEEGTFEHTNNRFNLAKHLSVDMTSNLNRNTRELADCVARTKVMEKELDRATEIFTQINWYFTNQFVEEGIKKKEAEEKADRDEEGSLVMSGAKRSPGALLQVGANVSQVEPAESPAPASFFETTPRWPGDSGPAAVEGMV